MVRDMSTSASFRTAGPSPSRPSRRPCGRRLPLLLFLATLALSLFVLLRKRDGAAQAVMSAADMEGADEALLEVLVRTKEAIENETSFHDIATYADRAKVLLVRPLVLYFLTGFSLAKNAR